MGRMLCAHRLSAPPSQPNQCPCLMFIRVGVLRFTSAAAAPRVRLSVQLRSGTWQVEQEKLPPTDSRGSKKSSSPKTTASRLPDTRLLGSTVAATGHGPWASIARTSLSENAGSSAATADHGSAASAHQ